MADSERLSQVFVELADTLVTDFDVVDFMTTLADRCVELLGAREAGVVLADEGGTLRSVASSNEAARLLDLVELQNDEGPCLECFQTGEPVINAALEPPDVRWPTFAPEARRLGFDIVHALPMRLRDRVIGAINIFGAGATLTPEDVAIGQALADVATVGLLQERSIREARVLSEQLQVALVSRVVIEQAKGILAERRGVDMDEAFALLRTHARSRNKRLSEVAQAVVAGDLSASELGSE